jgi:peptide deformylase
MIKPICRMGNPVLRQVAADIPQEHIGSPEIQQLIQEMQVAMKHYGGIGIAAPQLGISLQLAIIELPATNRYGQMAALPFTVFINPRIEYLTQDLQGFWEGCLSVPGLRGLVERPSKIKVSYLNQQGEMLEMEAQGFLATVIQHELDHLRGVLYVDRLKHPSLLAFQEEYDTFVLPEINKEV